MEIIHDNSGATIIRGVLAGTVMGKRLELFIEILPTPGAAVVYVNGWTQYAGRVGGEYGICVMKRGWFKSDVVVTYKGDPAMFTTDNRFGDFLRSIFGSQSSL